MSVTEEAEVTTTQPSAGRGGTGGTEISLTAPPMAAAFGQTFWWAVGLLIVAFLGSLTLPKRRPELPEDAMASAALVM
jgi:hypothetical protein